MKRANLIIIAIIAIILASCNEKGNSFYPVPPCPYIGDSTKIEKPKGNTFIVHEDDTHDEYGNCKYSPYTKFYEEWASKGGWSNGLERVYDAWFTNNGEYYVQTIKCNDVATHSFELVNHKVANRETLLKYYDTDKGYGGRKGMIFED